MNHQTHEALLRWAELDELVIAMATAGRVPESTWSEFLSSCTAPGRALVLLATSGIVEFDGRRRQAIANLVRDHGLRVGFLTDELLVRGTVSAISWLGVVNEAGNEAIHVFPQALSGGWEILERGPDVPLYDALLAHLFATYCIDTNRVYGIGHSNGAYLNAQLACLRTETLRAIANVSGLWNTVPNNDCVPMNYMLLTGDQDTSVNTTNAESAIVTFTTGCSETGTPVTDPAVGGTCTDYTDCPEGSSVRWCTHPGGHDWPQPFANQAIWTFLRRVW